MQDEAREAINRAREALGTADYLSTHGEYSPPALLRLIEAVRFLAHALLQSQSDVDELRKQVARLEEKRLPVNPKEAAAALRAQVGNIATLFSEVREFLKYAETARHEQDGEPPRRA